MLSSAVVRQPSPLERVVFTLWACALHVLVAFVLWQLKIPERGAPNSYSSEEAVRVRVAEVPASTPAKTAVSKQKVAAAPRVHSATAPKIPKAMLPVKEVPLPAATPMLPSLPPPVAPQAVKPNVLSSQISPNLAHLLPQASSEYLESQRQKGAGWDVSEPSSEDVLPVPEQPNADRERVRPKIVTTEFSTLAYRLDLERRFSDAWGGVRVLPSFSRFSGKTGELIVYNVVVNRDGSLRRIVNVSAIEQAGRDFSAVDTLVQEFADSVFPINPLPDRIREEPFIVRWAIRFMGAHYSFF
jgi:hypothetical protein